MVLLLFFFFLHGEHCTGAFRSATTKGTWGPLSNRCVHSRNERKEKAEKHMSGLSSHLKLRQTPFEAQQIIFSGGSGAAAYRLSLAFRIPLGVISAPTDPRGRLSSENTNKNGLRVISL